MGALRFAHPTTLTRVKGNNMNDIFQQPNIPKWPAEKPLYKYLKKEYAEKFLNSGELLISTLYDFRNEEEHGNKRGDKGEGKKEISEEVSITIEDPLKHNPLSPLVKKFIDLKSGAKNTIIQNSEFIVDQDSGDSYIYCMSSKFDKKLLEDFESDVCICIKSPWKFIKAISIELRKKADFLGLSPCKYKNRQQTYGSHDNYHASIIKPVDYKNQAEVRAIWNAKNPHETPLQKLLIHLEKKYIMRFCEILNN